MKLSRVLHKYSKEKKYLLAISGGMDSMVLLYLFRSSNLEFSVAHCNFQLRGEDSDLDQKLVEKYCNNFNIELFTKKFDTLKLKKNQESVEMIARNLRYTFFNELLLEHTFDYLVTAHHLNDNIETFFINLLRGSGLKGLGGMVEESKNKILRPLLPSTQKEVREYAIENGVVWREDYTNQTLDYLRNKIRHQIVPVLENINLDFLFQAEKSMKIIQASQNYIDKQVQVLKKEAQIEGGIYQAFSKEKLQNADFILLYNFFSEYGFTSEKEIIKILKAGTGKIFESQNYILSIDRERILVEIKNEKPIEYVEDKISIEKLPFNNKLLGIKIFLAKEYKKRIDTEYIDLDKVESPLILRNWEEGDFFYPINGMGKKKLSKFFKDEKIPNLQKKDIKIVTDKNNNIIWIVGYRIDDRFKVVEKTRSYISLTFKAN